MWATGLYFDAVYDWRCWHGQRAKCLILILGFAFVCGLLAVSLRLGEVLFEQTPPWVHSDASFFTLVREEPGLGVRPLNLRTVEKLREIPGIGRVSWIAFREGMEFQHDRASFPALRAAVFDHSLPNLVGANFARFDQGTVANSVWISKRLFREMFDADPNIIGTQLRHEKIPFPLTITGVLNSTFNRIGTSEPDIWLSGNILGYLTPFAMPSAEQPNPGQEMRIRQFLQVAPIYYGIFTAAERLDAETILSALRAVPDAEGSSSQVRFRDFEMQLEVLPGINLAPEARRALRRQWFVLTGLIVALAIVLIVNAITIFSGHWVLRWHDLGIMRMVGAGPRDFIRGQLAGLLPALGLLSGLSAAGIVLLTNWVENLPAWREWAGSRTLDVAALDWFGAVMLVVIVLAFCRGLPLAMLLHRQLFTRAVGTSRTGRQKLLGQAALTIQLASVLLAMMIAGSMALSEWQHHQNLPLDTSVAEIQLVQRGRLHPPAELAQGRFPGLSGVEVAAATSPLVGEGTPVNINHVALTESLPVHGWHTSANYFKMLGIRPIVGPGRPDPSGVVINRALADLLVQQAPLESVLGSAIRVEGLFSSSYPIAAIIEDLPHLGRAERHKPAIYLPLERARLMISLNVLVAGADADPAAMAIDRWSERNLIQPRSIGPTTIGDCLDEADRTRVQLLYSTLFVALLISAMVLIGIVYQVRARLALNRHEFGVRRAVGAPWPSLLLFSARDGLVALAMAVPVAFGVQWLLVGGATIEMPVDLFYPAIVPLAVLVTGLLVLLAAMLPVLQSMYKPIFRVLRED